MGKKDLQKEKELWEDAANTLMNFIKSNIAIVGFKEIEGFKKCKEAYNKALAGD